MSLEFAPSFRPRPIQHVLMDWDGTTALSRSGWGEVMTELYLEHLPVSAGEDAAARRQYAWTELMQLNGRPSLHQMAHLADLIVRRGGTAAEAMVYQDEFQRRLGLLVDGRLEDVRGGRRAGDSLLVTGVRELFETLRERGIRMTLASGTPQPQLLAEAELLGVAHYFEGRIHGPTGTDDSAFAKRKIIVDLLECGTLEPSALLAFGDGPVELSETKAHGGLAVAVASDEVEPGSGRVEAWKREMLLAAGADAVIADFRNPGELLDALTGR